MNRTLRRAKIQWLPAVILLFAASPSQAQIDEAYTSLADALGSPLFLDLEQAKKGHVDTVLMLRLEIARQQLMALRSVPSDLAAVRQKALETLDACHGSMENFAASISTCPISRA